LSGLFLFRVSSKSLYTDYIYAIAQSFGLNIYCLASHAQQLSQAGIGNLAFGGFTTSASSAQRIG